MTKISLYKDEDGKITGFTSEGHSGYADAGSDIVCAAVSVLTENLVNSVEELLKVDVDAEVREKDAYLNVSVKDYKRDDVQLLFSAMELGLKEIADSYKRYVKLTNRRCTP